MKKVKYFIFSLICLFSCSIVYAENEVVIESITPVYDKDSSVIVEEKDGNHKVIFNDKDQSVKYKVVLKNTTDREIHMNKVELSKPTEDFLEYTFDVNSKDDYLKANETKEITLTLETVKKEGWGRNFDDELKATFNFEEAQKNPNTSTGKMIVICLVVLATGTMVIVFRKNKATKYIVLALAMGTSLAIISAKESITLTIKTNASYESQNVSMAKASETVEICYEEDDCITTEKYYYFWKYNRQIKNIYFENQITEMENYAHKFDVSEKQNGKVIAYLVGTEYNYDLYIQSDGIFYFNNDASYYFADMWNLISINGLENIDTSNVTNMEYMFYNVGSMNNNTKLTLDLGENFDTSNVTNMEGMFSQAGYERPEFTLDLGDKFDTSNVTNMGGMFSDTGYTDPNFTLDLGDKFDTSNVTNMGGMFSDTGYNSTVFTLDLGDKFDTSNVTDMNAMFYRTGYNSPVFTLDLGDKFDTSNVINMHGLFFSAGCNNPTFTLDLGDKFDTSNVTNMNHMFCDTGYNSTVFTLDLGDKFDTSNVTDMNAMFHRTGYNSPVFTLDLGDKFDTSNVTDMAVMFNFIGYTNPTFTLDLGDKFDTSNVKEMGYMFENTGYNSTVFTLDLGDKFNTSKVTNMVAMFKNTGYNSAVFTLDVSNFDTSNVLSMSEMFQGTGYNSTKLNTSITIRRKSSYRDIFIDAATKPGSQITVNYTSATSSLVDEMIATKSSNSNVVKGVQVD